MRRPWPTGVGGCARNKQNEGLIAVGGSKKNVKIYSCVWCFKFYWCAKLQGRTQCKGGVADGTVGRQHTFPTPKPKIKNHRFFRHDIKRFT